MQQPRGEGCLRQQWLENKLNGSRVASLVLHLVISKIIRLKFAMKNVGACQKDLVLPQQFRFLLECR